MSRIKCISMWRPWANWVALEYKPVETRTHHRFKGLIGQRIGIHAAQKYDNNAVAVAMEYLSPVQYVKTISDDFQLDCTATAGAVICTALVADTRYLKPSDAKRALIECETARYGLFLAEIKIIVPHFCRGKQGIWWEEIKYV